MRAGLAAVLVAVAVTIGAAAAPAATNPCALVTSADAAAVLEAPVGPTHARAVRYRPPLRRPRHPMLDCIYRARAGPSRGAIVTTEPLTRSAFALVIAQQPDPVTKVAGLGGLAYIAGPHRLLMAWKHGTALYVSVDGTANPVTREKRLARGALGRL